jgi:DNA polymerase elongation subunit (family B)
MMKLLLIDIETAPNVAYVWGLFKENIPLQRLVDSGYVLCWAAKWVGTDEILFDSVYKSKPSVMLKRVHALLDEADAIIHYNGNSFDIPTLNKEFLLHKMKPPSPSKQIDLLLTSRSRFRFTSNKMDYVAQALGIGNKKNTTFDLWIKCMAKDPDAWAKMEEYNKGDVELLEGIYNEFKPWIKGHPNTGLYSGIEAPTCPVCGSDDIVRRGFSYTAVGKFQRYRCAGCGHWSRDRKGMQSSTKLVSDKT